MWGLVDLRGVTGHLSCDPARRKGRFKFLCPTSRWRATKRMCKAGPITSTNRSAALARSGRRPGPPDDQCHSRRRWPSQTRTAAHVISLNRGRPPRYRGTLAAIPLISQLRSRNHGRHKTGSRGVSTGADTQDLAKPCKPDLLGGQGCGCLTPMGRSGRISAVAIGGIRGRRR
jgi:hypothetical protein